MQWQKGLGRSHCYHLWAHPDPANESPEGAGQSSHGGLPPFTPGPAHVRTRTREEHAGKPPGAGAVGAERGTRVLLSTGRGERQWPHGAAATTRPASAHIPSVCTLPF